MAINPNFNMSAAANQFRKRAGTTHAFNKGDEDYLVYLLQQGLYNSGYNLHLNSIYDDATQAAVRAYQRDHGFVENGIPGPDMLNMLFPPDPPVTAVPLPAPMPRPIPAPLPRPTPKPIPAPAPRIAPVPLPAPVPKPTPMPLPAPKPTPMPLPAPAPKPIPAPLPAPVPCKPMEYTVRLNPRNPEAVIRVSYDGFMQ